MSEENSVSQRRRFEDQPRPTATISDPGLMQLMTIYLKLDSRGQAAILSAAAFHLRYPKEEK